MSKILKGVSLGLVIAMLLSMTAFAASISAPTVSKDARNVTVSGKVDTAEADQQVTILVVKSGVELTSVSEDDIAYIDQTAAGTDGSFSFAFAIDAAKGDRFNVYVGGTSVATAATAVLNLGTNGAGDCNGDGLVNLDDYMCVINAFGKVLGGTGYDPLADLYPDNMINLDDYMLVINNFGKTYNN